ncbi:MAG: amino acid ABC transporter ATP-binding protein [Bacteroidales bacterium]|nr:amino acid ABC transporter ATP-binding protein [Bacteroidales bacterium]
MITIKHLSKQYINPDGTVFKVLKDVNCEINPGEVISIIGPSGTGKSTFLRAINLLDPPTGGEILFDGENILAKGYPLNKLRQKMGMVFQSFNLFEHLSILDNVTFAPMKLHHLDRRQAEEEAMAMLRKVGMAEKAKAMPSDLSGGQKQRVAIARCLAMHPEVILFDEPTSALDPTMVGEVLSVLRQLASEGMTMLIVTHEMTFARDVSTRIFFMNEGIIYEDGTPQQIFENPVHSATKAFVQRIRKAVFEVDGPDYDMLGVHSQMDAFCNKYHIADKGVAAGRIVDLVAGKVMPTAYPYTLRLTYSELNDVASLDVMKERLEASPLQGADAGVAEELRRLCREIVEEPTTRGFRVKFIL